MRRFPFVVLASFLLVPLGAASQTPESDISEIDCDSACVLPDRAPPECACESIGASSSFSPFDGPEDEARRRGQAVFDGMQRFRRRLAANVDNYTVLEGTSLTPMPSVRYFEEERLGGEPVFREWTPPEILEWRAEQNGEPTPQEMGEAFEEGADEVGGALGQVLGSALGGKIAEGIRGTGEILQRPAPVEEQRADLLKKLWTDRQIRERLEIVGSEVYPWSGCGSYGMERCQPGDKSLAVTIDAVVARADSLMDIDLGPESEGHRLESVTYWSLGEEADVFVPLKMRAVLVHPGGSRLVMEQSLGEYHHLQNSPIPTRTRDRIYRFAPDQAYRIIRYMEIASAVDWPVMFERMFWAIDLLLNQGPPTAEEEAALVHKGMQEALPGMDRND